MNLKELNKYLNGNRLRLFPKTNVYGVNDVKLPPDIKRRKSFYSIKSYKKRGMDSKNAQLFQKLQEIVAPIKSYITLFAIYGSRCDLSYTYFSDVDSVMIIKKIVVENNSILKKVRNIVLTIIKEYMKIDPLQHHGVYIIREDLLKNYPEWFLPSKVLENSCSVYPEEAEIEFDSMFSNTMERQKLNLLLNSIHNNIRTGVYLKNMYELKRLLSQFFLLPAVYYQSKGVYYLKRDSFPIFLQEFPNYKEVFEKSSELRMNWPTVTSQWFGGILLLIKNPWSVSYVLRKVDWRIPDSILSFLKENRIIDDILEVTKTLRNEII